MTKRQPKRGKRVKGTVAAGVDVRRNLFIAGMVEHGNQTKAAADAGYSERSAHAQGSRLMKDAAIAAEVDRRKAALVAKVEERVLVTKEEIARSLLSVVRGNVRDAAKWGATGVVFKDSDELTDEQAEAIESVESQVVEIPTGKGFITKTRIKLRRHSKIAAARELNSMFGYHEKPQDPLGQGGSAGVHIHVHGGQMGFEVQAAEVKSGDKRVTAVRVKVGA